MIGYATHALLALFNLEIPLVYALLFGALISPIDPIAVLSMLMN